MATELDDGEFWLPPEFLTDDDILMDCKSINNKVGGDLVDASVYLPFDFSSSGRTSPEIESDEEDYLAGWRKITARTKFNDRIWKSETGFGYDNPKVSVMATSPQSTLCNFLGGCGCQSPTCPSRMPSPPPQLPPSAAAVLNRGDGAQDLLLAAAGELARLRMFEEVNGYYQNGAPPCPGFYPNDSLSYTQLQVAQFQQQQQMLKQQAMTVWGQMKPGSVYQQTHRIAAHQMDEGNNLMNSNRLLGLSPSAWPTLQQSQQQQQQQPSSGIRPVFVGNHAKKPERAGTGVFLPRQVTTSAESRRKPSSILLPDQVFKAMNLNLEENIHIQSQFPSRYRRNFPPANYGLKQQPHEAERRSHIRQQQPLNHEIQLPQEWTY